MVGAWCLVWATLWATAPLPSAAAARRPATRLVVLVVIDQMRGSELDCSLAARDPGGGFARLCREGRIFRHAALGHGLTETASGHATLATGAAPRLHGVLDKVLYAAGDHALREVCAYAPGPALRGPDAAPDAACNAGALLLPTLGERLLAQRRGARSVALAAKGRSANLLAGAQATLVAWDAGEEPPALTGRTDAGPNLPAWLRRAWAQQGAAAPFAGWRTPATPMRARSPVRESCDCGFGPRFPHELRPGAGPMERHAAWLSSPQSDAAVVGTALAVQQVLGLGSGAAPDLLMLSLAATDRIGHCFGPAGPEREAILAAVDLELGRLLAALERAVPQGLVVAVTADHGMMPHARDAAAAGRGTGTLSTAEARALIKPALAPFAADGVTPDTVLLRYPFLFLPPMPAAPRRAAATALADAFAGHPAVWRAWTREALVRDAHPVAQLMAASTHPARGGDVVLALRPYHRPVDHAPAPGTFACGSRHGSPWRYDRRVPLALWGEGVAPGVVDDAVDITQLGTTLARVLGLQRAPWAAAELP